MIKTSFFRFLLLLCFVSLAPGSLALGSLQDEIAPLPEAPPSAGRKMDKVQKEALENFIKKLESKQDRRALIDDLRTLVKAEDRLAQERPSSHLGLSSISNGLHSITSKIIEFFDEAQRALGRLSKKLQNETLKDDLLVSFYKMLAFTFLVIGLDSGIKRLHPLLRGFFLMNARKEHLRRTRLTINALLFEGFLILVLFSLLLVAASWIKAPSPTSNALVNTITFNMILYTGMLHILRTLFDPHHKLISFSHLKPETAQLVYRFLRFMVASTLLGIGIGDLITLMEGPGVFYAAVIKIMLMAQCIFTSIFVVRVKERVGRWLLSQKGSHKKTGLFSTVARTWHVWTLVYLSVFGLTIYFQTINDMKEVVISFGATAFLVLIAYILVLKMPRISYRLMDKIVASFPHVSNRHGFYGIFISLIFGVFIIIISLYCAFKIWDLETVDFLFSDGVKPVFSILLNIFFIALMGVVVWEANEYLIQKIFTSEAMARKSRARRQRLATMMPLVQIIARSFILGIFVIMAFSELKLDVTPLLAGLGVIGIAFSFGSQSLVKDFITGIFILIEDTMNVGDIVQIDTQKGIVETLSLRTVKLRDTAGDLHTIPFSSINRVTNMTKNFAYYVIELVLPFEQELDPVLAVLKEIDQELHEDPDFSDYLLSPLEIMGLDRFSDYGVVILARIKTVPDKNRWKVGREFNLRIQRVFNERHIEFSTSTQKIVLEPPPPLDRK